MQANVITIARSPFSGSHSMLYRESPPTSLRRPRKMSNTLVQGYAQHCNSQKIRGGATRNVVTERPWPCLADLSTELVMLILEQLLELDPRAAANARRVCRRLDDIAAPLVYRTVSLNKNIASREAEVTRPEVLLNIFRYTTHLTIPSNLDPYWVRRILEKTERLQQITWRYVKMNQWERWSWRPSHVLDTDTARRKRLKLHIEDLPVDMCGGDVQEFYIQSVPPEMLVSLKLGYPTSPLSTQLQALKDLLLQAHNLKTFHYRDRGQGTHFTFTGTERLPPFEDLRLESYDWNHSPAEVAAHWDLSRLTSLQLVSMPTYPFLASVSLADLSNLHTLVVDDFSLHDAYRREEATALLHALVGRHVRALRTLDLRVHTALFPLDAVARHAASSSSSLEVLRLRDHTGFGDENVRVPTLSPADLVSLTGCPLSSSRSLVHTLELDMDVRVLAPSTTESFLRGVMGAFPRLHTLTLHVHTLVDPHEFVEGSPDRDRDFAYGIFGFLVAARRREGRGRGWRRIEVNVGGWTRGIVVRRLGEAWKALNKRGVFGERLFVLVGGDDAEGYKTGEEFGGGLFLGPGGTVKRGLGGISDCRMDGLMDGSQWC